MLVGFVKRCSCEDQAAAFLTPIPTFGPPQQPWKNDVFFSQALKIWYSYNP